jgi:hypothetical protein
MWPARHTHRSSKKDLSRKGSSRQQKHSKTDTNSDKFRPSTIKIGEGKVGLRESMAKPGIKEAERQN